MEDMVQFFKKNAVHISGGSNDTLYQRNAALSAEECCRDMRHNFLKDRNATFFSTMTDEKHAVTLKIWVDTVFKKHVFPPNGLS